MATLVDSKNNILDLGTAVFTFAIAGSPCAVQTANPTVAVTIFPRPTVNGVVRAFCGPTERGLISIDLVTTNPILTNSVCDCSLTVSGLDTLATDGSNQFAKSVSLT